MLKMRWGRMLWLVLWLSSAAFGAKPPIVEPGENPLVPLWRDRQWVESFLNYDPDLAPKLTAEEQAFYQELEKAEASADQPLAKAIKLADKIGPGSSALLSYVVATLYLREGEVTNAVRHLRVAVDKNSRFLRAHKNLGLVLAREGEFEEALPHLTRAVALGGGDGPILGMLGYCLVNAENYLSAQVAYQQAVLLDPDNLDWRLGLIKCYIALGNLGPAVDLLDELIEKHPDREQLWGLQASVFVQLDRLQEAIVNLEALRRLGEITPQNLALLGDLYVAQDCTELALPVYLAAIEADPGEDPARALRAAEILIGRGAWEEARRLLARAKDAYGATMPEADTLKLLRLEARLALGSGAGEEAITMLEEIVARDSMDGEALLLAGDYYAQNGQPEKADYRYQRAARLDGFSAEAWVKQAQLLVRDRKYPEAIELLNKAQKLEPRANIQTYLEKVQVAAARAGRF